jgi:hypothetical protein
MTVPQARFFYLEAKYPAFVGGFGTGKTETLVNCAVRDARAAGGALIALYEPTFDLVRLILAPRMQAKLSDLGVRYRYNKTANVIYTSSSQCGDFVLRSLDNPARIVGYESYRAHVDELDTLPLKRAEAAWNNIIARNRQMPRGVARPFNRVSVYTTPEGFRFVYRRWVRDRQPGYEMVQAATTSNPFLPSDYVESLRASYAPQLIDAYIEGRFVNLAAGAVYPAFSREANHMGAVLAVGEPVHVGMDFNVGNMAAVVFVVREERPVAVAELTGVRDTPAMAALLRERYLLRGHAVTVYPDASGAARKSVNAAASDLTLLQEAGLQVRAPSKNPPVRDRINAVNALILNECGVRRLAVNVDQCPRLVEALEQQVFDRNGEPEKVSGFDHVNDAAGYFLHWRWPVRRGTREMDVAGVMAR